MSTVLNSFYSLARPSGLNVVTLSDLEQRAFSGGDMDFMADPAERAAEFSSLVLRDRVRGRLLRPHGTTPPTLTTLNNRPAIQGYETASDLYADWQLGPSYTIFSAFETGPTIGTNDAVVSSFDQAQTNRMYVGPRNGDRFGLVQGIYTISTPAGSILPSTKYVTWTGFNADNVPISGANTVEIGLNSPAMLTTGRASSLHDGQTRMAFFGGTSDRGGAHKFAPIVVCNRYLGGEANLLRRTAIMAMLAEMIGVTLPA